MEDRLKSAASHLIKSSNSQVKDYNIVFRQLSSNLLIVSGILLALSTQITGELKNADLLSRALAAGIVIALTLSMTFGIIQQLLEAEYFRKGALKRRTLIDDIVTGKLKNADMVDGKHEAIREELGRAVTRWASIVQFILLGVALALIITTFILYLFI